jgi:hypothetical protein
MKESRKSLQAFFIVVSLLNIAGGVMGLVSSQVLIVASIVNIIVGLVLGYFGIRMKHYLDSSPKTLKVIVVVFIGAGVIFNVINGTYGPAIVSFVLGSYLVYQIDKLSKGSLK